MLKKWTKLFFFSLTTLSLTNAEANWLKNALELQSQIDADLPLNEATFIGTHNSYNAKAYQNSFLRYIDPNQNLSIYDQLEEGIRSIELDAHWALKTNFQKDILLCHGLDNHLGCNLSDRPFVEGLKEISDWLEKHPNAVILLYIERHLDGQEAVLAAQLEEYLGKYIFKPSSLKGNGQQCLALPSTLTKNDVLRAGKQVIIVTKGCDAVSVGKTKVNRIAPNWTDYIFTGIGGTYSMPYTFMDATITQFTGFPDCGKSTLFQSDLDHQTMWRVYEDRSQLGSIISPEKKLTTEAMQILHHCGINWPTVDFLEKEDERLKSAIWSWALSYPHADGGHCAIYQLSALDPGIRNIPCTTLAASYYCKNEQTQAFTITRFVGTWRNGESICQLLGPSWHFSLPQNGKQAAMLKDEMIKQNLFEVWLNYALNNEKHWQVNLQNKA